MMQQFKCNSCGGVYVDVQSDGTPYYHACPPLPPDQDGLVLERPDKRNENIDVSHRGRPNRPRGIIAEGKGVQCLTNARLIEPAHLTAMKARIESGYESVEKGN